MTVSNLISDVARALGLGAAFLCWFYFFFWSVCLRLDWGQRSWCHTTELTLPPPKCALMMAVSALECVQGHTSWRWLPPSWSDAGPESELPLFPPSVRTLIGTGNLSLSGEQCQSKRCWSSGGVGWWACWGGPGKPVRGLGSFNLLPPHCDGSKQVFCVCAL